MLPHITLPSPEKDRLNQAARADLRARPVEVDPFVTRASNTYGMSLSYDVESVLWALGPPSSISSSRHTCTRLKESMCCRATCQHRVRSCDHRCAGDATSSCTAPCPPASHWQPPSSCCCPASQPRGSSCCPASQPRGSSCCPASQPRGFGCCPGSQPRGSSCCCPASQTRGSSCCCPASQPRSSSCCCAASQPRGHCTPGCTRQHHARCQE